LFIQKDHATPQYDHLERKLIRIATRGVVTLFNAISKQQKMMDKANEKSTPSKSAPQTQTQTQTQGQTSTTAPSGELSKKGFLQLLKSSSTPSSSSSSASAPASASDKNKEQGKEKKAGWDVFKDDYMLDAESKHWDQDSDDEEEEDDE
jgi:hypothetical protein